ncbi:hypothetical protein COO91_00760 [Nostoc flagelliforme CCNUN1]|uniref:Uncharacterized protein n=1 Tax=Nostoc flagelliforme CCNUN1 TaxID=2038116 RepID=A0A2K8SHL3_9NOSO|nr:hypothetical protein COO91_00760 [Nostoc flagelliforme CCNUN1]
MIAHYNKILDIVVRMGHLENARCFSGQTSFVIYQMDENSTLVHSEYIFGNTNLV